VLPVFDRLQAGPVQQLERGRDQPAPGDLRHRLACRDQVGKGADDRPGRAEPRGPQPQRHLGHHAEGALRPHEQADQVEPGDALGGAPPETHHVAIGHRAADDRPQAEYVVAGDTVFQAAQAARVGGDVAADRRPRRAGRVGRVPQAVLGHGGLDVVVDRARLDHGQEVVRVDLDDLVQLGQVEDDAAADRVGAAGQPGARAPRHDGSTQLGAGTHHMLDLGFRADADADRGPFGRSPLGVVVGDGGQHVGIDYEAVAGQPPAQCLDQDTGIVC